MIWIIALAVVAIAVVIVWKIAQSFSAAKFHGEMASKLSVDEAEQEFDRCWGLVLMGMHQRGNLTKAQVVELFERAVYMQDRINELNGLPHGPAARLTIRSGQLKIIKQMTEGMDQ